MRVFLCIAALGITACPRPVCSTLATRCDGEVAQICGSDGQWQRVADCDAVERTSGGEWSCQPTLSDGVEVHACVPERP
jgi:hypothetical protein